MKSIQALRNDILTGSPFFTTPLVSLQKTGWIGMGESRLFLMEAMGGFYSLREQISQELGPDAEAEIVQRAGFASAERIVAAGQDSGELTADEAGFHRALALLSIAGYGQFRVVELKFDERWARIAADGSVEGWMFRESGTRPAATCDYIRGLLAGIMHFLSTSAFEDAYIVNEEPENGDGTDLSCVETACIAAGEETCQFVLGPANLLLAEGLHPAPMSHSSVRETLLRLNRQLEQILDSSRKDSLTKLYNRSYFEAALRQKIGYAKRRSDVVSLAIIDIDFFKQINDTHGHTVGDRVLRQLARHLEVQARENDIVARLGGDEFVWLMPATTGETATAVAQRLRRTLEELQTNIGFPVTASIGIANYPHDAASPSELFEHADTALFAAKRAGRDRAMRFVPEQLPEGGSGRLLVDATHGEPVSKVVLRPAPIHQPTGEPDANLSAQADLEHFKEEILSTDDVDFLLIEPEIIDTLDDSDPESEPPRRGSRFRKAR